MTSTAAPAVTAAGARRPGPAPAPSPAAVPRRRARRWLAVALAGALALAGCSSDPGSDGAQPPDASELPPCPVDALDSASGPVEVLLWYQLVGEPKETLLRLIEKYNSSQSKVRVRAESQGADYDELFDAYKRALPANQLPDIANLDETPLRFLVDSRTVLPAQACFEADGLSTDGFNEAALSYYTVGDVLYAASASLSNIVTYYNKSHFRQAGLDPERAPATLAEVRTYAERLRAAGVVDRPVVLKLAPWFLESQLTGARQAFVDNDNGRGTGQTTKATFDTDTTRAIYTWIADMVRDGLLNPKADTPGQFEHYLAMAQQSASIFVETSTAATTISAFLGGDTSIAEEAGVTGTSNLTPADVGVGPLFGVNRAGNAQIGGNAFYITNTGPEVEQAAAWDFLKWWNQPEQQKEWLLKGSYLPFLSAVGDDPDVQAFWEGDVAGRILRVANEQLAATDPSFPGPAIGPFRETREIVRASLDRVALAGGDPAEALRQAVSDVDTALQTYNEGL